MKKTGEWLALVRFLGLAVLLVGACSLCGCEDDERDPAMDYFETHDIDESYLPPEEENDQNDSTSSSAASTI
jgi:hypothetical protein